MAVASFFSPKQDMLLRELGNGDLRISRGSPRYTIAMQLQAEGYVDIADVNRKVADLTLNGGGRSYREVD